MPDGEDRVRYWIFQANPIRYRIHESLVHEREEWWNLNQHGTEVRVGDRVAIWISGSESGIYAMGTVVEGPIQRPDSISGQNYWQDAREGRKVKSRVRVRYEKVLLERPLLKVLLEADPELWDLGVIRAPRGTNFPMRKEEWWALQNWINEP